MADPYTPWLTRAQSSLALAKTEPTGGILLEDLCYQTQQAAEKALKALLLFFEVPPEKTHNLVSLLQDVEKHIPIPRDLKKVVVLTDYAVQTRYPGDYTPVTIEEYQDALKIATQCVTWVKRTIKAAQKESQKQALQPLLP